MAFVLLEGSLYDVNFAHLKAADETKVKTILEGRQAKQETGC